MEDRIKEAIREKSKTFISHKRPMPDCYAIKVNGSFVYGAAKEFFNSVTSAKKSLGHSYMKSVIMKHYSELKLSWPELKKHLEEQGMIEYVKLTPEK